MHENMSTAGVVALNECGNKVALHELPMANGEPSGVWTVNVNNDGGMVVVFCGRKEHAREVFDRLAVTLGLTVQRDGGQPAESPNAAMLSVVGPSSCTEATPADPQPSDSGMTDEELCFQLFGVRFGDDSGRWERLFSFVVSLDGMDD